MNQLASLRNVLESEAAALIGSSRAVFLLAYSQRFAMLFELFEQRVANPVAKFEAVLSELWSLASGVEPSSRARENLAAIIPGEDWVVDGFYDAIAQYVGGLAIGALEGMNGDGQIAGNPEQGIFDLIRLLLSEMRLGCTEPGEDAEGVAFDSEIHNERLVIEEEEFWRRILKALVQPYRIDEIRRLAFDNVIDPESLEPDLSEGLARDDGGDGGPTPG